jgi:peptide/nickel transport system permease protein
VLKFLLRRLANYVVLVTLASSLAYLLAAVSLDPRSNYEGRNPPPPAAVVERDLSKYNLNDKTPVTERFATWVSGLSRGDLGKTSQGDSVNAEFARRIGVSLRLLLIATVVGGVLGVLVGAYSAVRQYQLPDHVITLASFVTISIPVFVFAVLVEIVAVAFNQAVGVNVFEYTGEFTPGLAGGFWAQLLDRLQHLVLPTFTLVVGTVAALSRYQRSAMLDVLNSDFVRTARAKGLPRRTALLKHALRTALIPAATYFAYSFGLLLVGAAFVEKIFGWHGMGEFFVDSVTRNEVNAVAAGSLFAATLVLIAGLLSDIAYAALDPRIRVN